MRVVSADSSSAILNDNFEPLYLVAPAAVLVCPPCREANDCLVEPISVNAEDGNDVIVHEAELCRSLLTRLKAYVVHLDM